MEDVVVFPSGKQYKIVLLNRGSSQFCPGKLKPQKTESSITGESHLYSLLPRVVLITL